MGPLVQVDPGSRRGRRWLTDPPHPRSGATDVKFVGGEGGGGRSESLTEGGSHPHDPPLGVRPGRSGVRSPVEEVLPKDRREPTITDDPSTYKSSLVTDQDLVQSKPHKDTLR